MPPVGFEPAISAGERPQTYALDSAATGTGKINILYGNIHSFMNIPSQNVSYVGHKRFVQLMISQK